MNAGTRTARPVDASTVHPVTLTDLAQLPAGTILWLITGNFTASRVRLLGVSGVGATRRPRVEAIDTAPGQSQGDFSVSAASLRPLAD